MNSSEDSYPTIESVVGETPLVRLQRLGGALITMCFVNSKVTTQQVR